MIYGFPHMKKVLLTSLGVLAVVVIGGYIFRGPLLGALYENITSDMFVGADTDAFDPGLAIGDTFPPVRAMRNGKVVEDMGEFITDRGMVFIANRSVDW